MHVDTRDEGSVMAELSDAQVEEIRGELERELVGLGRCMQSTSDSARPVEVDQTSVGRLSRIDAVTSQHRQKDLHQREEARESHILDALQRIEQGSYGRCTTCAGSIPFGRLLVMPEARTCATCGA
jgi:DnaK suppressor protein